MKVIFILGTGHCGSTLLDMLLGSHSDIVGVGELDTIRKQLKRGTKCTCGMDIDVCPLWSQQIDEVEGWGGMQVYRNKVKTILNRKKYQYVDTGNKVNKDSFCKNQTDIYKFVSEKKDAKVIVDSSKNPDRVSLISKCDDIKPIIVHLVRDGRGVLWSYKKKYSRTMAFIWKWLAENLKIELIKEQTGATSVFVKYSDLCENPKRELSRVLSVVGLDYEDEMQDFRRSDHHQVGGNRMRLKDSSEIQEDLSWKAHLGVFDRALFWLIAGWLQWYYD